jgi:hypothetical protein
MKLLIRKLWFQHSVDETVTALFRIPQMQEQFDENYAYDREMRPKGIKICPGYWSTDEILNRLPDSNKDVYLILTSLDLKGDYGRIHGKGHDRKAIVSNDSFGSGRNNTIFDPIDIDFQATAFHEIGHALGLLHHDSDPLNSCAMSHQDYSWSSLEEIHFCNNCYKKIK